MRSALMNWQDYERTNARIALTLGNTAKWFRSNRSRRGRALDAYAFADEARSCERLRA